MAQTGYINIPVQTRDEFALFGRVGQPQIPGYTNTNAGWENCAVQGNYCYVVGNGGDSAGVLGLTLSIYNIINPNNPILVSYITTGSVRWESGASFLNGAYNLALNGNYAYIASAGSVYLYVVDISSPSAPFNVSWATVGNGSVYDVCYLNGYCYCATQTGGLVAVNVSNPLIPVVTFTEGGGVKSFGVATDGKNVYTTQYVTTAGYATRQIKSWSISTPSTPILIQSLKVISAGEALGITVQGRFAYVSVIATGINAINVIDITNPSNMLNVSQIIPANTFNSGFVAIPVGNYLFIPSGSNTTYGGSIEWYDIAVPSQPLKLGMVTSNQPNSVFGGIAINNGYIFSADYGVSPSYHATLDTFISPLLNVNNQPIISGGPY